MPLFVDPNFIAKSLNEWLEADIKGVSSNIFALGKFLFSVSSGTIGLFITIWKFAGVEFSQYLYFGIFLIIISNIFAILIVLPKPIVITSQADLILSYRMMLKARTEQIYYWTFFWCVGVGVSTLALSN